MDCFLFLMLAILFIAGVSQVFEQIKDRRLQKQMTAAFQRGDTAEYMRLANIRARKKHNLKPLQGDSPSDLDYLEAMVVLDAAEHGIFFPDGHLVFDRIAGDNQGRDTQDAPETYFTEDYSPDDEENEYTDHWGLG